MALHKSISLIGLMGAGKTTLGAHLAHHIFNVKFIDSDELITKQTGRSIKAIFAEDGEDYFRQIEQQTIKEIIKDNSAPFILSVGGGAFINQETQKLLLDNTIVIWLRATLATYIKRLSEAIDRPLLENVKLYDKLQNLINERYPIYKQAAITIDTDGDNLSMIGNQIKNKINEK